LGLAGQVVEANAIAENYLVSLESQFVVVVRIPILPQTAAAAESRPAVGTQFAEAVENLFAAGNQTVGVAGELADADQGIQLVEVPVPHQDQAEIESAAEIVGFAAETVDSVEIVD
jgi:hypothetical protein